MERYRIKGADAEAEAFITRSFDDSDYIAAHTSGSTGTPKEIRLLKSDMRASARATNKRFGIAELSRLLCPLSASYIAGKMMIVRAIEAGCELIMEKPSNRPMSEDYGEIDLMAVVPSQCTSLLENETAHRRLKNLIVGGAPIAADAERRLKEMPWKSFATYGMTETCSHVALRRCGEELYEAMPGITFSTDERNCLIITAPLFSFGELITNDVISIEDSRHFRWCGRYDNVINSGGVKLYPEMIEKKLYGVMPTPFYIHPVSDEKWGTSVGLTIERCGLNVAEIIGLCRSCLSPYEVPKHVSIVAELPRTANGKIKRY